MATLKEAEAGETGAASNESLDSGVATGIDAFAGRGRRGLGGGGEKRGDGGDTDGTLAAPPSPQSRPGPGSGPGSGPDDDDAETQRVDSGPKKPVRQHDDGAFDGSFAGTARRKTETYVAPWWARREYFTRGWADASIWRACVVEAAATAMITYTMGQFGLTVGSFGIKQVAGYVGIYNTVLLSVFIYAAAPASGGHMNPLITWTTFWCGLCPAPRGVLYIIFQTLGAALGGGLLRGSWGTERAVAAMGGGCFFDPATISPGQVFLTEIASSWVMVFLGIGVGLDPRQAQVFGPQLGPLLVGLSLGVMTSSTTGTAPGYTGANMNPARCLALSVARGSFDYHWIWWIGPAIGGLMNASMYNFAPPFHAEKAEEAKKRVNQSPA